MIWHRIFLGLLAVLNLFLTYNLLLGDQGLVPYLKLKASRSKLKQQVEVMHCKVLELSQEVRLLKSDRQYIEKIIRAQMNFVKPNEILYVFPKQGRKSDDTPPDVPLLPAATPGALDGYKN